MFSFLTFLALIWLVLCVTGIVTSKTPGHYVITIVAAVILSAYLFEPLGYPNSLRVPWLQK